MQPFQRQLLMKLRRADFVPPPDFVLLLLVVLLASSLLLLVNFERRILVTSSRLVVERLAVLHLMSVQIVVRRLSVSQCLLVVFVGRLKLQAVAAGLQLLVVICGSSGGIMLRLQFCVLHLIVEGKVLVVAVCLLRQHELSLHLLMAGVGSLPRLVFAGTAPRLEPIVALFPPKEVLGRLLDVALAAGLRRHRRRLHHRP